MKWVHMVEINENELASMICENDENIKNIIYENYGYLIDILIKKHAGIIAKLQLDKDELRCEASYGFSDGINSYSDNKEASLKTFLSLCIERRITNYIAKCSTKKAQALNDAISLNVINDDSGTAWIDSISDDAKYEPLSNLETKETYDEIINMAKENLSEFEYIVFVYMINDIGYQEIAKILDKSPKQIDNTMQRIKLKMKKNLCNIEIN